MVKHLPDHIPVPEHSDDGPVDLLQRAHDESALVLRSMIRILASPEVETFVASFLATQPPSFEYEL